jgi:hypothetical protein
MEPVMIESVEKSRSKTPRGAAEGLILLVIVPWHVSSGDLGKSRRRVLVLLAALELLAVANGENESMTSSTELR